MWHCFSFKRCRWHQISLTREASTWQRILVVEDDDATRYAMARELAAAGYDVAQAWTIAMRCRYWKSGPARSATRRSLMPGVNGFALARMARLRRQPQVVYVTGYDDLPVHEAMGPILRKPVMPDTLVMTVRKELSAEA